MEKEREQRENAAAAAGQKMPAEKGESIDAGGAIRPK
jgi:hypothetical protein